MISKPEILLRGIAQALDGCICHYRRLPDAQAKTRGYVQVVYDSDEGYLYPETWIEGLQLSATGSSASVRTR